MKQNSNRIKNPDIKLLWDFTKDIVTVTKKELHEDIQHVEKGLRGEINEVKTTLRGEINEVKVELKADIKSLDRKFDMVGSLVSNTHQEVKNFIKFHEILDTRVSELERKVARLEQLVRA